MYGYYINLASRTDRKVHMDQLIQQYPFFSNLQRFNAISHKNGAMGCSLSHASIIETFLSTNEEMLLLLEDDFVILNEAHFQQFVSDFEKIRENCGWDIIVLTPRGDRIEGKADLRDNHFHRIRNNQTTTGYIVKREFATILLENIKEGMEHVKQGISLDECAIDQFWKRLQDSYSFYYYERIYGGQLEGFSTIENRNVNYNDRYLKQM